MRIDLVHCSEDIADKLAVKHQVEVEEAEEILWSSPRIRFRERGKRKGEDLYSAFGQTDTGRYLTVLFIYKPATQDQLLSQSLIISARDLTDTEHKQYERK